jgi:hypothetical protein
MVMCAQVGRWGEELVFQMLRKAVEDQRLDSLLPGVRHHVYPLLRVVWVNDPSESGLPYDVVVVGHLEDPHGSAEEEDGGGEAGGEGGGESGSRAGGSRRGGGGQRSTPGVGTVLAYVEVKSSGSQHRDVFELSRPELAFAEQEGQRYHVVRVWGATGPAPRVQAFQDPVALWRQRQVAVCLLV